MADKIIPFWKIVPVAVGVGLLSGLLANSGGILFGPLFIRFLRVPTKKAIACRLVVSAGLAIPGTITHAYLRHIDWTIVLLFGIGSIPFSYLVPRVSLMMKGVHFEKLFGAILVIFGTFDLVYSLLND